LLNRRILAALWGGVLALALLIAPVAAHASTKQVLMGPDAKTEKTLNTKYSSDVNAYFPDSITVHVGDSVKFVPANFHTVDFPKKGGKALPLFSPTGSKVSGANDGGGQPFWFNGVVDQLGFTPALLKGMFGKSIAYNGKAIAESGLPIQNKPKPFTVRFTKTGTFTYFCDIHPGMKGKVHVVAKTAKAPSAKDDAKVVKKEITRDLKLAAIGAKQKPASPNTVDVGSASGHGVEYFGFLPGNLTIAKGTTLTFQMPKGSVETHTATFGPGDPEMDPNSYLGKLAGSFEGPAPDPIGLYPSDPPGTPASLTSTSHGNGFWNSGALDAITGTPPPASNSVRFDEPGTYNYYCLIHPFMHGVITVTG
jgi:plastocyanin